MPERMQAFGERLLPQVVDALAESDPWRIFGSYLITADFDGGFRDVSMKQLADCVNVCAWWMKAELQQERRFEVLAYVGIPDFRYTIVCLAAIKCEFTILLLGPKNSFHQNESLLSHACCTKLLYSNGFALLAQHLQHVGLRTVEIESLDVMLGQTSVHFPFNKSFHESQTDPIIIVHSSGSTGNPKLITMTHGTVACTDNDRSVPVPQGRSAQNGSQFNFEGGGCFFSSFPPYHLAGLQSYLILPILSTSATIVLGPPGIPPSGFILNEIIKRQPQLKAVYAPPSVIEQWLCDYDGKNQAKQLHFVLYGGGPLAAAVGNALDRVTSVCQMYGSAEIGQVQLLTPLKGAWDYMEWNPSEEVDMQPVGHDLHEAVLRYHPKFWKWRSLYHNIPASRDWYTGDLFIAHPTKPGLWKFHTRKDDLIVLSNGHKVSPQSIEAVILEHPSVSAALVVGTGRMQTAVLLELKSDVPPEIRPCIIAEVWSLIQNANERLPEHARIASSKILVGTTSKPFVKAPKGTIVRKLTAELYAAEIEELYQDRRIVSHSDTEAQSSNMSPPELINSILARCLQVEVIENSSGLFTQGLNSTNLVEVLSELRLLWPQASLRERISLRLIYQNPTVDELVTALSTISDPGTRRGNDERKRLAIPDIVKYYTASLPAARQDPSTAQPDKICVILTGSSGSLGSFVLDALNHHDRIYKIYCLERKVNAHRHSEVGKSDRIEVIQVDFTKRYLGLPCESLQTLLANVSLVLHFGWTVDFNIPIQSFEHQHFQGLRNLMELCLEGRNRPRLVFASSTAYALDWALRTEQKVIPETVIEDVSEPGSRASGYAQSKQVAELMLTQYNATSAMPVTVLRMGQLVSSLTGQTQSQKGWITSLLRLSELVGAVPTSDLTLNWVRLGDMAVVVEDLVSASLEKNLPSMHFCNIVNPNPTAWADFARAVSSAVGIDRLIPLNTWVDLLREYEHDEEKHRKVIGLRLLPFFQSLSEIDQGRSLPRFAVSNARLLSDRMNTMEAIASDWT